jgi:hypothetical protein
LQLGKFMAKRKKLPVLIKEVIQVYFEINMIPEIAGPGRINVILLLGWHHVCPSEFLARSSVEIREGSSALV